MLSWETGIKRDGMDFILMVSSPKTDRNKDWDYTQFRDQQLNSWHRILRWSHFCLLHSPVCPLFYLVSLSAKLWFLWKTLAFLCKRFCNLCQGVIHTHTHNITHCQADNLCVNVHTRVCSQTWGSERVLFCTLFSKPSIRQITIHQDNGALMAAVKIIFDRPALSCPHPLFFVCLSISLTSISLLSHNPLCHSPKDSESLQHAGLRRRSPDKNPLCETSPSLTQ